MAELKILAPFILSWEGGFVNHPLDKGGATNRGVTLSTWRKVGYDKDNDGDIDIDDLRLLDEEDVVERVLRPFYWNRWQGDRIKSQPIANILVDWVWGSGVNGIRPVQGLLGVKVDGVVGEITLSVLNTRDPYDLFQTIKRERERFLHRIVERNPDQKVFLKGWLRRLDAITFNGLRLNI